MIAEFTARMIEAHIAAGRLSPGARGMKSAQACTQHNQANGLQPADPGYLIDPAAAQSTVRLGLRLSDHLIPPGCTIVLTDAVPGYEPSNRTYAVSPSQVAYALDQVEQVTGARINPGAVEAVLPWEHDAEDWADSSDGAA